MKKALCALLITVCMLTAMALPAFAAEMKIAYVDVAEVFDGYQKTKDQDLVLKAAGEAKEKERTDMTNAIRKMEDELALLSADARATKQEQLIEKKRQLEDFDRTIRQQLAEQRDKVVREIFQEIDTVIQDYCSKRGYDIVLNKRVLLFQKKDFDITAPITAELAKKYKKA
ncbi:MAG TPA: OmpH family outer membrane protein [Candidatus Omnitrophota bacterium]|nr:OmpH family outer membrane protein [Candidatus Omnitrophota bacterium]HPS37124.1 OmpH family outer membrane protein [Candidatus Omnitrophota bacterium]